MKAALSHIKQIRVSNNDLWMEVLEIALKHAPGETKLLLAKIRSNDLLVTGLVKDILNENSK
jgi:hypothetical protein